MKSLLDPSFKYVSSTHTDIRKTFERVRKEQEVLKVMGQTRDTFHGPRLVPSAGKREA